MKTLSFATAGLVIALTLGGNAFAQANTNPATKPGEYAQNSAVYAEFLRNCQRPFEQHYSSGNVRANKLEDDSARRMEEMYRTNRAQYDLQIKGCQMSLPVAKHRPPVEQKVAANVSPMVAAGAGVVAGVVVAKAIRNGRRHGFSTADQQQLNALLDRKSVEVLGARPANSVGFEPSPGRSAIHCRGGRVMRAVKADGGTYSRVYCP